MSRSLLSTIVLVPALTWLACAGCGPRPAEDGRPVVFVSIPPQADFVQRIAGDAVAIEVLIGPGQTEHTFEPTPRQMARLGRAKLFFVLGLGPEAAILRQCTAINPDLRVVECWRGIERRAMTEEEGTCSHVAASDGAECAHHHSEHGHDHEHGQGGLDPHIWLDPRLVQIQARTICAELSRRLPRDSADFASNLARFESELRALDARLAELLAGCRGRELFVFHPSYGYLADRYGLKQVAVEVEGKEPSQRFVKSVLERMRAAHATTIFYQPQFGHAAASVIAREIGGQALPLDPLGRDYIANMQSMGRSIQSVCGASQ